MLGLKSEGEMLESASVTADNLAFVPDEKGPDDAIRENGTIKNTNDDSTTTITTMQSSTPVLHRSSIKVDQDNCASKRVSFAGIDPATLTDINLYKKRFWMLALFSVCSMLNGAQWLQYTVVSDVSMCFYGVDIEAVNWTANLYLILYLPLAFHVARFTNRFGIKNTLLVGSFLTCVGTAMQCGSTTPNSFTLVLLSQACSSVGQVFILGLPPYISATWFAADEVSRASAVGVFGNQLGCALGFIFTPLVVASDCENKPLITKGKQIVAYTLVTCNIAVFLLILTTFKNEPEKPPSIAAAKKLDTVDTEKNYWCSVKALLKNVNYDLLLLTYGIIVGTYFAVSTILNSLVSVHFKGRDTEIGWMGLISILSGTVGSVIAGYVLDWTHRFKETSIAIFVLSFVSMVLFAVLLNVNYLWLQFITITIMGFFLTSYLPVGFEYAVEITYPESEAISAQLLNLSTMACGQLFTVTASCLVEKFSDIAANIFFCAQLLLGSIITALIKCDFRRQRQSDQHSAAAEGAEISNI